MKSKFIYTLLSFSFLINLLPAQDFYPVAVNNKWTYDIYDDGVFVRPSTIEITELVETTDSTTVHIMSTSEPGYPDIDWHIVESIDQPDIVFVSVLLDTTPTLLNWQHHSYTVGDTIRILLTDYEVKDHGNYTTMKGLSFDNCIRLESLTRDLDLVMAPNIGLVAQWEVETPNINMLELVEFRTDTEIISDVKKIENLELNVYPNPTTDFLMVENKSDIAKLDMVIYDLKGSVIYKNNLFSNSKIDVSNYEAGTYFLTLSDEHRIIETKTIFIQ